jgi:hypothetical protein
VNHLHYPSALPPAALPVQNQEPPESVKQS